LFAKKESPKITRLLSTELEFESLGRVTKKIKEVAPKERRLF